MAEPGFLAVFSLALAKIYGVPITGSAMTGIIISIIVLLFPIKNPPP